MQIKYPRFFIDNSGGNGWFDTAFLIVKNKGEYSMQVYLNLRY